MVDEQNEQTRFDDEQTEPPTGGFTRGTTTADQSSSTVFDELRETVEMVDAEKLLNDPEYREFLDSLGEFEMAEDSVTMSELLDDDEPLVGTDQDATTQQDEEHPKSDAVTRFIEALEKETVTDAQRERLREALGIQSPRRIDVQLNHLKSRFLDLEAYLQAMEDVFDADTDFLEELERCTRRLDDVRADIEALKDEQTSTDEALGDMHASIGEAVDRLDDRFTEVEEELEASKQWRTRVEAAFRAQPTGGGTIADTVE